LYWFARRVPPAETILGLEMVWPVVEVRSVTPEGMEVLFTLVVELSEEGMSEAERVVPELTRPFESVVTFV
jgi:GTPase